jgi:hypothetical protein
VSMRTLESSILHEAREAFRNRSLRLKDIREWSTGTVTPQAGEVVVRLPIGVDAAVLVEHDKRAPK